MGTSLAVQWLRLHASTAGGAGSIPGWGTKIPHAGQSGEGQEAHTKKNQPVKENTGKTEEPESVVLAETSSLYKIKY